MRAARRIQSVNDEIAHDFDVATDAVDSPVPLLLRTTQALSGGQAVQRDDEAVLVGESPVLRGLLIRVDAQSVC